jgi:hypothetical protein
MEKAMNISDAVKYVGSRFRYKKDPKIVDYWFVMDENDGIMNGDCEDFSLTVFWKACDESLFTFIMNVFILHKYRLYFSKTKTGERHAIGYANGLWFDNWTREALPREEFIARTGHKIYFFFPSPLMILPLFFGFLLKNTR